MSDLPAAPDPTDRAPIGRHLDQLLRRQLLRLRRRFLLHGLGALLLLVAAAVLIAFLLDHTLRLPAPVRLLHSTAILCAAGYGAYRFVRRPLRLPLSAVDVAVLLERQFPALHQRLVSAVQLDQSQQQGELRNQSAALVEALLQDTAAAVQELPLQQLLTPKVTAQLWSCAGLLLLLLGGGALLQPATAWAFMLRQLGLSTSYPRATTLVLELPPDSTNLKRHDQDDLTVLTMPAGADLHVSVLAEGAVPDEAFLDLDGGNGDARSIGMTPRPGNRFRHVFRRISSDFGFHARGGDDDTGDRRVEVRIVHPPAVAQITAAVTPPAYTGQPPAQLIGGAVDGLAGSGVQLTVTATGPVQAAELVFLESGQRLPLQPTTIVDDSGRPAAYTVGFVLSSNDRYQIELIGAGGLRSPTPGAYPVTVLPDYTPVGRWLQPDDESVPMLLPDGVLCVRLEVHDDYGLTAVKLGIDSAGKHQDFELLPTTPADQPPLQQWLGTQLYEVKDLLASQKPGLDGLALAAELADNCAPQTGVTALPRRTVQIVDPAQLSAAISRHFRSLREGVEGAQSLQLDRKARVEELLGRQQALDAATAQLLTGVEVGQGRVQTAAQEAHRQLMRAFDLHLWNRLEPSANAAQVLELYRAWFAGHADLRPFAPEFYRDLLQRRRDGSLGAMEQTLDPILAMVAIADQLATGLAPQSQRLLAEAQVATNQEELTDKLRQTVQVQGQIEAALQDLLARLDAWNDYQDLIQETRALRDRQKDVQGRTEELRGGK